MKRILFITVLLTTGYSGILKAQHEAEGMTKFRNNDIPAAKQIFTEIVSTSPKNALALFGLGECYYHSGQPDSAKICYQKGIEVNSSVAGNYAGLGIIALTTNPNEAELNFKETIKKSKKECEGLISIAQAYYKLSPKKLIEAKKYIDLAISVDSKNGSAYLLKGLISLENKDNSDASLQFDRAIYFNPNLLNAYLYESKVMAASRNFPQALEYANKPIAIDPSYWPAYKNLGELYYENLKYSEAVSNFEIYFNNVTDDKDITHFAYSLFFDKQYQKAKGMIEIMAQHNSNDYILLRLLGYISYETKDMQNGKSIMDKFFSLIPPDKILSDDYLYYGKMLSANGNDSLAIEKYKMALIKDPDHYQIYDELTRACTKTKQYEQALSYQTQYLNLKPAVNSADYFQFGKLYYSCGNNLDVKSDSLKQLGYFQKADSLFEKVEINSPTSYLGSFWRARVNSIIDKESTLGLAKPHYEKALEILLKDPVKYKKEISEVYAYLGFYYFVNENKNTSVEYWKKLQEIDPENTKAQEALKSLANK